jgi:glutaredoxin
MSNNTKVYEEPSETTYTIYTKPGCPNCVKAKKLLEKEKVIIIECEEYLLDDKESFLKFIQEKSQQTQEIKTFPMIFYKNQWIGGYTELIPFYDTEKAFDFLNE